MPDVVSDTTPILSLLKVGQLNLLNQLYGKLIILQAVFDEVEAGRHKDFYTDLYKLNWVDVRTIANREQLEKLSNLGAGEAEAITLANEIKADLVLIDERIGRFYARKLGLKLSGTLGVLLKAKQAGHVQHVKPIVNSLLNQRIFISDRLKQRTLELANEL